MILPLEGSRQEFSASSRFRENLFCTLPSRARRDVPPLIRHGAAHDTFPQGEVSQLRHAGGRGSGGNSCGSIRLLPQGKAKDVPPHPSRRP